MTSAPQSAITAPAAGTNVHAATSSTLTPIERLRHPFPLCAVVPELRARYPAVDKSVRRVGNANLLPVRQTWWETVDDDAQPVTRRGPFATNPSVGTRGHQAQLRILDAALELFGEVGYHECAVQRITERSGCSRASFYQYFSSKEDLFRHLAGRVARELLERRRRSDRSAPTRPG